MLILSIKNLFFTAVIFCIFGSIELNSATTQISTEKSESKEWDIIDKIKKYLDNVYPSTKSGLMNILEDWRTEGLQKIKDSGQNKDSDPFIMDKKKIIIKQI
jgi:DNA phosphorothioation-dependent restriction protein DptG